MFSFNFFILILGILSALYAIPYANYEFSQKNKKSAIIIYIIALLATFLSVLQFFV